MITHGMSSVLCEMRSQTKKNRDMSKDLKLEGRLQICLVHCQKSKTSKLNRQSTPKNYQRKVTSRRQATTEVPPSMDQEDKSEIDQADVNDFKRLFNVVEQRRAADKNLVDKVENGRKLLQIKILNKVLLSLASKIGMESISDLLKSILNVDELTIQYHPSLRRAKEFTDNKGEKRVAIDEKLDLMVKEAPAAGVVLSRLVDLYKIIKILTKFCQNIYEILAALDEYQPGSDDFFLKAGYCLDKLICLKTCLPEYLIGRYKSAELFHKFITEFYVKYYLSNFFVKDKSTKVTLLRRNILDQLPELAKWLQLFIPMLVEFVNKLSSLKPSTLYAHWKNSSRDIWREQLKFFSDFNFSGSPCKNNEFAFELMKIADVFIEDVSLEILEMCSYLTEKADF